MSVRLRGALKVLAHLMLGLLVVAVKGLFALLSRGGLRGQRTGNPSRWGASPASAKGKGSFWV